MTSSRSEVDTRHPFRSVKEAVAIFGERILSGEAYSQSTSSSVKPQPPLPIPQYSAPSPSYSTFSSKFNQDRDEELSIILSSMKKLEAEVNTTKCEVTLLKEKESETKNAVAALNAELHKSKAKLAEMDAASGAVELHKSKTKLEEMEAASGVFMEEDNKLKVGSDRWGIEEEDEIMEVKYEYFPSLAATVMLGEADDADVYGRRKGKVMKKKPIVPLIGNLFSRKKDSISRW